MGDEIERLDQYVGEVINDWEEKRVDLVVGAPVAELHSWPALRGFVAGRDDGGTFGTAAAAMSSIQEKVVPDLVSTAHPRPSL